MIKEYILGYEVERKKVKNINLRIRPDGSIYISIPTNIDTYYVESFIKSKKEWIDKHIKRIEEIKSNMVEENYVDGSKIRFLGNYYNLKIEYSSDNQLVLNDNLFILYTDRTDYESRKKIVEKFYFKECKKLFNSRIEFWKQNMNEEVDRLILKIINGKWGYCRPDKKIIALNILLIKRTLFEIDYVIIHELAHLKYPDHSKNFYRHIQVYMTNYKDAEKLLKFK